MFAAIPFPSGKSRIPAEEPSTFPSSKMPAASFFGQSTFGGPTPDLLIPPRTNNPPSLAGSVAASLPDGDCQETDDLNRRKLRLTVETLEKQSHLLSLQIWHYECQYGLPHSEFSRRFGEDSPDSSGHRREQAGIAEKDTGVDPGEGTSGVDSQQAKVDDEVLKKQDSMEDSDDTEEEGLCTDDQSEDPEKASQKITETAKPSTESSAAPDTSFTSLFGQPPSFGSISAANIFGGIAHPKPSQTKPSINFSLPQVSQASTKTFDAENATLSHRQLELAVETLQKQSHLLSLQILHYESQHRIPHSDYSRMFAVDEPLDVGQKDTGEVVVADSEPIDYTMTIGSE